MKRVFQMGLLLISGVAFLVVAQDAATNKSPAAKHLVPHEVSAAMNPSTNLPVLGIRHQRIWTDASIFEPSGATSLVFRSVPFGSSGIIDPAEAHKRLIGDIDAAELINAAIMRDYQRRFERHLQHPRNGSAPALHPTLIERITP